MKKMKTLAVTGVMVLLLGASTAGVFASSAIRTPDENLQYRIERLQEGVELGILTQERADEIAALMQNNILDCDGSAQRLGLGLGQGRNQGLGLGHGQGRNQGLGLALGQGRNQGLGFALGQGRELCDGSEMRICQGQ